MSLRTVSLLLALVVWFGSHAMAADKLTPGQLKSVLANGITETEAQRLAEQLQSSFGKQALRKGVGKDEGTTVMWAIEVDPGITPRLVTRTLDDVEPAYWIWDQHRPVFDKNTKDRSMQRVGSTNIYVAAADLPDFSATAYRFIINDKVQSEDWFVLEHFPTHPDSVQHPSVPQGKVTKYHWKSKILDGTERNYWLYVPAQCKPNGPAACLMVFNDGKAYLGAPASVPTVLDNLISKGDMPVTVALFINPGEHKGQDAHMARINEYHDQTDRYARFLRDEIIPEVSKLVTLRQDSEARAICGESSGAVCAFTAAWQMPSLFGRVMCHVGSFVNIKEAYKYPYLIRESPKKALRIYLQGGSHDLDDECGSWSQANQQMATALQYKGYNYRFDYGRGYHSLAHGAAILPDALKWLWRDQVPH